MNFSKFGYIFATSNGDGNRHVDNNSSSSNRKSPDDRKKKLVSSSSNSDAEKDAQSFITQPDLHKKSITTPNTTSDVIREVNFSPQDVANLRARYEQSLFAKVLGKRIGFEKLSCHLLDLWSPKEGFKIIPLENDYFLLEFSDDSDYRKALEGIPWMIDRHYITLRPWTANFKPTEATITRAAVWICLRELPVEYYDRKALEEISAHIGRLIKIDPVTERKIKCKFARLCIELDLSEPLRLHVHLPGGVKQAIYYEGLHVICYECSRFGHRQENCPWRILAPTPRSTSPPFVPTPRSHYPSRSNSFVYDRWSKVPPTPQELIQLAYHPRHAIETGSSASSSRVRAPGKEQGDSRANPEHDHAVTNSPHMKSALHKRHVVEFPHPQMGEGKGTFCTYAPNKPATTSSQVHKTEEANKGDNNAPYTPEVFTDYLCLGASTLPNASHRAPTPHQVVSTPPVPSLAGPQSVSSARGEFDSRVAQAGMKKRVISTSPVKIQEQSNQGCPTLFVFDSQASEVAVNVDTTPVSTGIGNLYDVTVSPKVSPTSGDDTKYASSTSSTKKMISWTCRGASTRIQALNDLCKAHNPSILLLLETRTSDVDATPIIKNLGFSGSHCIDPMHEVGGWLEGGVWLLWKEEDIHVKINSSALHHFQAVAKFPDVWVLSD